MHFLQIFAVQIYRVVDSIIICQKKREKKKRIIIKFFFFSQTKNKERIVASLKEPAYGGTLYEILI